jgi:hypothetical protein
VLGLSAKLYPKVLSLAATPDPKVIFIILIITFFFGLVYAFFMVQIYLFDFTKQFSNLFSKKSLCFKLTHQYFYILINIKYY